MRNILNLILNIIVIIFSILSILVLSIVIIKQFIGSSLFIVAIDKLSILNVLWIVLLLGVIIYYFKTRQKIMMISVIIGIASLATAFIIYIKTIHILS
ncbi:MAG TPA: hypothetical protein DCZ10_06445 [Pelotomaculum sp.]|nr:hypothetical protein [Pelotomaculum sp.]